MYLLIDIGNSGAKAAIAEKNRLLTVKRFDKLTFEVLLPLLEEYRPTAAIYSSVAGEDKQHAIFERLNDYIKITFFRLPTALYSTVVQLLPLIS